MKYLLIGLFLLFGGIWGGGYLSYYNFGWINMPITVTSVLGVMFGLLLVCVGIAHILVSQEDSRK